MSFKDHKAVAVTFLTTGTILLLGFLFPNTLRFKYEFEEGKIWRYEDLIAPFDFGILKPDEELKREYLKIDSLFSNHYVKDPGKVEVILEEFKLDFERTLAGQTGDNLSKVKSNPQIYLEVGNALIRKYYGLGIVDADSLRRKEDIANMQVLEGNQLSMIRPLDLEEVQAQIRTDLANSSITQISFLYPLITRHIHPNIYFDLELTQKLKKAEKDQIAITRDKIARGELIVAKDVIITSDIAQRLSSYRMAHEKLVAQEKSPWFVWSGYLILMAIVLGIFTIYVWHWLEDNRYGIKVHLFIQLVFLIFTFLTYIVEENGTLNEYLIPFCIVPIVLKTFFDDRIAFVSYVVLIISIALIFSYDFEFLLLQTTAGLVAIISNKVTRYWSPFFRSILMIGLTYGLGYLCLTIIKEGSLLGVKWELYSWFVINLVLSLLAYPMVPLIEKIFGFTSAISLAELGDLNRPLLKELSLKAPGTFQHSLQVANIAEAAAEAIGADSLLLRVSALYHDIGKIIDPDIFVENQAYHNPHDQLTPVESAQKIISHVAYGVTLAQKHRLPGSVIDMIRTHHGTTRVEYFYKISSQNQEPKSVDQSDYTYPGPKPTTREEVILMLSDSIEAACKSLKQPTTADINQMVDKIFNIKQSADQFSSSEISYQEMEKVKSSLKKLLKGIYHLRVEYPDDQQVVSR